MDELRNLHKIDLDRLDKIIKRYLQKQNEARIKDVSYQTQLRQIICSRAFNRHNIPMSYAKRSIPAKAYEFMSKDAAIPNLISKYTGLSVKDKAASLVLEISEVLYWNTLGYGKIK